MTAAFVARGLFLAVALPFGDPLDERYHLAYADFIAETGRIPKERESSVPLELARGISELPRSPGPGGLRTGWREWQALSSAERSIRRSDAFRFRPEDRGRFAGPNYETQQAPIFYGLGAGILQAAAGTPVDRRVLALRLLAVLAAAAATPIVFLFFRRLFPAAAALAATAAWTAYPGLGTFTGRFTNDAVALPLAAALLILLVDAACGRLDNGRTVILAAVLALGLWTKVYFLPLLPAPVLAAIVSPRAKRRGTLLRAAAAAAVALALFVPWLAHQRADTGDWLGIADTKAARRAGVGPLAVASLIRSTISIRYLNDLFRGNVFPGTWTSLGAPAFPAALAAFGLAAILLGLFGPRTDPDVRRRWWGAAAAIAVFAPAQMIKDATLTAGGGSIRVGAAGWYGLILLPAALAVPAVRGRAPRRAWLVAAIAFVAAELVCTFGVLPAAYAGAATLGARSSWHTYAGFLFSPAASLRTYSSVSLVAASPALLASLALLWFAAFASALAVVLAPRPPDGYEKARPPRRPGERDTP